MVRIDILSEMSTLNPMINAANDIVTSTAGLRHGVGTAPSWQTANTVPSLRQSVLGVEGIQQSNTSKNNKHELTRPIFNPRLSPSTVSTEKALEARSIFNPEYKHNLMATRIERTSSLLLEAPRFSEMIDILA